MRKREGRGLKIGMDVSLLLPSILMLRNKIREEWRQSKYTFKPQD
jgi:hypothetical protein